MKLVWPVSHAHMLSHSFFLIPWSSSFHTVLLYNCLLKNKKETAARGETKAAEGRRVTGVSEVGKQDRGGRFHLGISPNFGPQFLRRKYGKSPQFLRRNRIGILPVAQYISADQKDRWLGTVACSPSPQNRAVQTHFLTLHFGFRLFNTHCQSGRLETCPGERNTGTIRDQCRKPG